MLSTNEIEFQPNQLTFPVENDSAARAAQSLVSGWGYNIAVLEGVGGQASCHKATHMRHVSHQ